ncbi:hypothetical protein B0T25DRAFT_462734 [Lasiosphaeria hispida]|uniref:Uncharacterized protein n=1 Tax=Lasiosphaeria hispida TaxID=260671 RepID=A0AAJ0H8S8_9PEZI|nr:hypothetical protein B0T25DRAFT_462734 [Lasiosphaeria hispida]
MGEPTKMSPTCESKPPRRPDKIPIEGIGPGTIRIEGLRKRFGPEEPRTAESPEPCFINRSSPASPGFDPADAAIDGTEGFRRGQSERSAMGWAPRTRYAPAAAPFHSFLYSASPPWNHAYYSCFPQRPAEQPPETDIEALSNKQAQPQQEDHLRQEMETLRKQLKDANSRADQAERVAEEMQKHLKAGVAHTGSGNDTRTDTIEVLKSENKGLRAELDDARSHIFSLQPYRQDLTPEEKQDYDDLVTGITDWVTKLAEPVLDDPSKMEEILSSAKKRPAEIRVIRNYMVHNGDLVNGCMFPETDIDIFIAIVTRFLHDNVFQRNLFGVLPGIVEFLSFLEASMQNNVEPKRDLFALRTWRAEAFNAIICSEEYQTARVSRVKELTLELSAMFKIFRNTKDKERKSCYFCQESVIKPAVTLQEKLLTSTHHFYLDLNPYIIWNMRQELEISPEFLANLPKLQCENILQNRKPFNIAKLDPRPAKNQLDRDLTNVLTVVPALYMRQIGKGDAIKEPTVVRKQQVLVAWGDDKKREKFAANSERTLVNRLYYLGHEREERPFNNLLASWRHLTWG